MRVAFKEWTVVVDAQGLGEQIILLRKGGIREGKNGFSVEHQRFLLFPTSFHQQRGSVLADAQVRFDIISSRTDDSIRPTPAPPERGARTKGFTE